VGKEAVELEAVMLLLSEDDVETLMDPTSAIMVVADCFRNMAMAQHADHGRLDVARQDPKGSVLVLAGHADNGLFAAKTNVHVYPEAGSRRRLARSMMTLWNSAACEPLALIATTLFNNHRTGAGLAAGAAALAPEHAETLVIFGAGKIAPAAIRYIAEVRSLKRIFIFGQGKDRALALADVLSRWPLLSGCDVSADADLEAAVAAADIIVTLTTSSTPVFPGRLVKPGALVILAGANRADAREADDQLIERAHIYADDLGGCQRRAGDIVIPLAMGVLKSVQIAGSVGLPVAGRHQSRPSGTDVTVFKSMGIIEQDIALAAYLLERAKARNQGITYDPWSGGSLTTASAPSTMRRSAL
jgi:ornithine cyclodeaminase